jgi:hypothetical protein
METKYIKKSFIKNNPIRGEDYRTESIIWLAVRDSLV